MAKLTEAQARVVEHKEGNILISASAGSGKTHTMIERIINLIVGGHADVDGILAVTFTEKSAADMKEKLKKALVDTYEKTNNRKLVEQLNKIPTADISTIHGFCARLIRAYFYKVGLSPDFKIADEADSAIIIKDSMEKTFRRFYASGEEWFSTLVDRHAIGRADEELKKLIFSAYEFCRNEPDPLVIMQKYKTYLTKDGVEEFSVIYKNAINKIIKKYYKEIQESFNYFDGQNHEKGKNHYSAVLAVIDEILNADAYRLKGGFDFPRAFTDKKLDEEGKYFKEKADGAKTKLKDFIKAEKEKFSDKDTECSRTSQYYEHIEGFCKVLEEFIKNYDAQKREENVLDFSDLEHFALLILKDQEVKEQVQKKYKYVFIDEYQDVNTMQEEILSNVSNDNLLMVGDLKQGIYAFRGCRSEIFAGKLIDMPKKGQKVERLNENFRSAKKVVDMVNEIFDFCMTREYFEEDYKDSSRLVFGGLFPDGEDGRAKIHQIVKTKEEKKKVKSEIYDVLSYVKSQTNKKEGKEVALVTEIINDELTKEIYDVKLKKKRKVEYKDIAILARAKNSAYVTDIAKGLVAHGISVVSDVKENVCDFPEISMLVNLIKLIDCFEQDVALASTMKSPIGDFSDEDLYLIAKAFKESGKRGNFVDAYKFYITNGESSLKQKLIAFDEYIKNLRFTADFMGAHGALTKTIREKNLESFLYVEKNGKTKVLRLKRFVLASVVGGRKLSIKEFLKKIETSADSFGLHECGEEDAVSVMTMHASKGLEFPVVIVCGLEHAFSNKDDIKEILLSREYGFIPRYYDEEKRTKEQNIIRNAVIAEQREARIREEMRLFYVATTRATYSLHLIYTAKEDDRKEEFLGATKFSDFIPDTLPVEVYQPKDLEFSQISSDRRQVIIGKNQQKNTDALKERFEFVYPYLADNSLPLKSTVTKAVKNFEEDVYDAHVLFDGESTDTEKGTVAHKILELLDFNNCQNLSLEVEKMIDGGYLTSEELGLINLDRLQKAIIEANLISLKNHSLFREKGFLVEIESQKIFPDSEGKEKVVLQGVIDLLAVDGDSATIIDYKYSTLTKDGLLKKYKKQLELYAYAVEKSTDKKVARKTIVNVFTGESVEVD